MANSFICDESPRALVCKKCAKPFDRPTGRPGRMPHFCSPECKQQFLDRHESREKFRLRVESRKREKVARSQRHKEAMAVSAANRLKTCVVCQASFARKVSTGRDAGLCCSRQCGFEWQAQVRGAHIAAKHVISKAKCHGCASWFVRANDAKVYCSIACRPKPVPALKDIKPDRLCVDCMAAFEPKQGRSQRCSACQTIEVKRRTKESAKRTVAQAAGRKARKLRLRGVIKIEAVNPITVLKRDRWTCQLCGIKTPQHLRGSYEDRAPEVDHINPLSQGGEHSYRNTQCACRKCNIAKSGTPKGQLRLFG